MEYRQDHVRLLKVFAKELPKRPSMKVTDLAKAAFSDIRKRKPDCESLSPDRACRNALRKPREEGHIEISARGEYRLTQLGAGFCKSLDKFVPAPDRKDGEPRVKRAKSKKTAKKVAKKVSAKKVTDKKAATAKVEPKKETKPVEKKTAAEPKVEKAKKISKPILPPPRKTTRPTAEEDAAALKAEAGNPDPDETIGEVETPEEIARQLNLG